MEDQVGDFRKQLAAKLELVLLISLPLDVRQILQVKCWHLKTSEEKHTNCGWLQRHYQKISKLKG